MFFSTVAVTAFAALAAATPVKRGFGGRATFYATGLGACGDYNNDSDFIVALNSAQYGGGYPGPECGKQIEISANGKTAIATIKDECPTCNYGDLDMSPSLFNVFSTPDAGVFQMTWDYVGSEQARAVEEVASTSSTEVKPSSTSEAASSTVASSSEWSAPSSSSAWSASVTPASSSAAVSSSSVAPSPVSSFAAAPTVTAILTNNGTLEALAAAVAQAGQVVIVGANSNSTSNGTTVANATVVFQ